MDAWDLAPALTVLCFLICDCRGEAAHSWSLPETVRKESKRLSITKSACGRNDKQFCSTLTLNMAQANHTGFYSCKYLSTPTSKKKKTESTIYIFINGKISVFYTLFAVRYKFTLVPWKVGIPSGEGHEPGKRFCPQKLVECIFSAFLECLLQSQSSRPR